MNQSTPADYDALTRQHYQDTVIAEKYREEYAGPMTLRSGPARVVANRERRIIYAALSDITRQEATTVRRVLDLPCGTGKLASVFAQFNFKIVAADISRQMMEVAAREYNHLPGFVGFEQTDASATKFADEEFDAVICLRLLHRVPDAVRSAILVDLGRISRKHVIVSVGLTNSLQQFRRQVRKIITGTTTVPYPVTRSVFSEQLSAAGLNPIRWTPVLPVVSSEWIVLCEKACG
jgi:ubiquinone/menaquinone biosynthesis C-methylase UbiE